MCRTKFHIVEEGAFLIHAIREPDLPTGIGEGNGYWKHEATSGQSRRKPHQIK